MKYKITELARKRRTKLQKPWGEDLGEVMNFIKSLSSLYPKGKSGNSTHEKEKN